MTNVSNAAAQPSVVTVEQIDGRWTLVRNGEPYEVRGIGGENHLELAAKLGANSVRTWGQGTLAPDDDGRSLMDRASELDMTVVAGFWVQHFAGGYMPGALDYSDPAQVEHQRAQARAFAEEWKDHPALLVWGIGNEVLGSDVDAALREIDAIAAEIKAVDPNHPTMTVLAGVWPDLAARFAELCPNVDILGVNAYGGMQVVPKALDDQGYEGPWMATEFGPLGHWEVDSTDWGAEVEMSSSAKADFYRESYAKGIEGDPARCVGSYVFYWGQKQERTETWYSLFTETGEKNAVVDAMADLWGQTGVEDRAPSVSEIEATFACGHVSPSAMLTASIVAEDPEGNALRYDWIVRRESDDKRQGGDPENRPERTDVAIEDDDSGGVTFAAPAEPGAYRLYVYVHDDAGSVATANVPFMVDPDASAHD